MEVDRGRPAILNNYWNKGYNVNRTHAYYIPQHYLSTVYTHLYKMGAGCPSHHIDWQLGELCKRPESMFLCLNEVLAYQGGGVSDIGEDQKLNTFEYSHTNYPQQIGTPTFDLRLCYHSVGYGDVGVNSTGYESPLLVDSHLGDDMVIISAHAPSSIIISSDSVIGVRCLQNGDADSFTPSTAYVDRVEVGQVQRAGSSTESKTLDPGIHILTVKTANNGNSHTLWSIECRL